MVLDSIAITTNASGACTGYTSVPMTGYVESIRYVPDGSSPLDTGWDATITTETSGQAVLSVTNGGTSAVAWYPRAATCSTAAAAALYASGGTAVNDRIPIACERIKVVIAQGGNALKGTLYFYVGS